MRSFWCRIETPVLPEHNLHWGFKISKMGFSTPSYSSVAWKLFVILWVGNPRLKRPHGQRATPVECVMHQLVLAFGIWLVSRLTPHRSCYVWDVILDYFFFFFLEKERKRKGKKFAWGWLAYFTACFQVPKYLPTVILKLQGERAFGLGSNGDTGSLWSSAESHLMCFVMYLGCYL